MSFKLLSRLDRLYSDAIAALGKGDYTRMAQYHKEVGENTVELVGMVSGSINHIKRYAKRPERKMFPADDPTLPEEYQHLLDYFQQAQDEPRATSALKFFLAQPPKDSRLQDTYPIEGVFLCGTSDKEPTIALVNAATPQVEQLAKQYLQHVGYTIGMEIVPVEISVGGRTITDLTASALRVKSVEFEKLKTATESYMEHST